MVARNVTATASSIEEVRLATRQRRLLHRRRTHARTRSSPDETCDVTVAFQPATEGDDAAMVRMDDERGHGRGAAQRTRYRWRARSPCKPRPDDRCRRPTDHRTHRRATDRGATTVAPTVVTPTVAHRPSSTPTTVPDRGHTARRRVGRGPARRLRGSGPGNATISYDTARSMTVDQTQQFVVTATIQGAVPAGTTTTSVAPDVTVVTVALRCEVQAQLRGADFRVDPAEFQPRSFLDQPSVEWSWDVVPLKAGTSVLNLEIRSVAVIDGRRIEGAGTQLYQSTRHDHDEGPGVRCRRQALDVERRRFPARPRLGSLLVIFGALAAAWRGVLKRPWPWKRGASTSTTEPKRDP